MTNHVLMAAAAGTSVGTIGPVQIGIWVAVAIMVVKGMDGAISVGRKLWGKPGKPPNKQLEAAQVALEVRVAKLEEAHDKVSEQIHAMHLSLLDVGEQRSIKTHARIDPLIENTAAIKGGMEAFTTTFRAFTELLTDHMRLKR